MRITISTDRMVERYATQIAAMPAKAARAFVEGLNEGGDKFLTVDRRAMKAQMGVKRYGTVVKHVTPYKAGAGRLEYVVKGIGSGLPIQEFPTRYSRSKRAMVRWDPRQHWKLQPRDAMGRFGPIADDVPGAVTAMSWGVAHRFKRSFLHPGRGPVAQLPGTRSLRRLYGPSPAKEIVQGQSAAAFRGQAAPLVETAVVKRLGRLLP